MSPKPFTLKVLNRPGKKPLRTIPDTIDITAATTVEEAKKQIAQAASIRDYNRIAILDSEKQTIIKDRNALLASQKLVAESQEIMVKDLGAQISWRGVYLIEYAGPIIIHLAFLSLRSYIYRDVQPSDAMSATQLLSLTLFISHYIKRELETLYVHKFSSNTMPFSNIYKNCGHYWILSGVLTAYSIYHPNSMAAQPVTDVATQGLISFGVALWTFGELANLYTHLVLSSLRSPGGTERGIPKGFGFDWVTCPNYFFEVVAWTGVLLVSRSLSVVIFLVAGAVQMQIWANGKEKRYRQEFGDKYKTKKVLEYGIQGQKRNFYQVFLCGTLLLDLHTQFDARKFVFVLTKRIGDEEMPIVTHLLFASWELGLLHHNVRLKPIPDVSMNFLFTRFAWSIFLHIASFIRAGVDRTLIGTTISTIPGILQVIASTDCSKLFIRPKSQSQSPSKRTRTESNTEVDYDEDESGLPLKRRKKDEEIDVLGDTWLKRERLRSNPDKTQIKEESGMTAPAHGTGN